ncbi:encapsulin [Leptospira interrogans]|uniref:encapsulin n=1 Tax=Leptospira interrogans TaxID=173 RepID=UPI003D663294
MPIPQKSVGQDSFLTKNDQLYILSVLLTPAEEELKLRKIARVNPTFPSYAREIGYDTYNRQGKANVVAAGSRPKDISFVDESIDRTTQPAVDIKTAIRYSADDLEAMQAKRAIGKGAAFSLDQTRIESARRLVAEREDYIGFNGEEALKVPGIFASAGYKEPTPNFANLTTAKAMLEELHKGKTFVEKSGHFKGRTLCLTPEDQLRLLKPLNDYATVTLLEWFKQNGLFFDNIITTNALKAENNILGHDLFMVLDSDPRVLELAVLKDITLGTPETDWLGETKMLVDERFGGALVYYPEGIYVGKQEKVSLSVRNTISESDPMLDEFLRAMKSTPARGGETKQEAFARIAQEVRSTKAQAKPTSAKNKTAADKTEESTPSENAEKDAPQSGTDSK